MPSNTAVPMHKLIGLEAHYPAGNGLAVVATIIDAKSSYGRVRVLLSAPGMKGQTATAWADLETCVVANAHGTVAGPLNAGGL